MLKGYPFTLGLAVTLVLMTAFAPIVKLQALVRRWTTQHVPLLVGLQPHAFVEVPEEQVCCGQPAYNSGDRAHALAVGKGLIRAFHGYPYVVAPSGSCAGMLREHFPALFAPFPDLAAGAAKRSSDLGPLEVVAGSLLAIGDGAEKLRELARPMVALYVGGMGAKGRNFYNDLICRYGFEQEAEQIQDLYLDGKKDEAAALVPDELLEKTTLCGPEGYVKERIAAFKESGCTVLNVTPLGDAATLLEQVKGWL